MLFDIHFEVEYFNLEPSFFCFAYFDLGYRGLLLASTTNLEASPRFADILSPVIGPPLNTVSKNSSHKMKT